MREHLERLALVLVLCACWTPSASAEGLPALPQPVTPTAAAAPAAAVSPELMYYGQEGMVTTASRHLQKLSEVPGSVTIITEREIRERGALTLAEMLRNFTGVEIVNDGIFDTVRIRGMQSSYNNKILILVDGRKVNNLDWGSFNDSFGNNLDNIKQVEVVKGPGSALYGANAFAGVINIITKDGRDLQGFTTKVVLGTKTGDDELSRYVLLTYGERSKDWDYVLEASYWDAFGVDLINLTKPNNNFEGDRLSVKLKSGDAFSLSAGFHKQAMSYPGNAFVATPREKDFQDVLYVDSKYLWELTDRSKLSLRVEDTYYLKRDLRQGTYSLPRYLISSAADLPSGAQLIINDSGAQSPVNDAVGHYYMNWQDALSLSKGTAFYDTDWTGPLNEFLSEVQYELAWPENNYLLAGVSYVNDWSGQNYFYQSSVQDQTYAAYVQDEYHATENLILLGGVRYDANTAYSSSLSPRVSAIYTFLPGFRLKTLYGTAFRAPMFAERYTNGAVGYLTLNGDPDLRPERTRQSEARFEYELGKWLEARAGYFYWETEDEIQLVSRMVPTYVWVPNLSWVNASFPAVPGLYYSTALNSAAEALLASNDNNRLGRGTELELNLRPLPYIKLSLNYTDFLLYVMKTSAIPFVDEGVYQLFNATLGFNYENRFFINFYAHHEAVPRIVWVTNSETRPPITVFFNQFDVSVGTRFKGVDLVVSVYNVLESDLAYDQLNHVYQKSPRQIRLSAEYTRHF